MKHYDFNILRRLIYIGISISILGILTQIVYAHGMSEADKAAIIEGGNLTYMQLGATHMLTGYDHLLFVFGIIFFLRTFRDIAKYVTAFTLGHSITLIFATFNAVQLNYFLIDAVIGLSVCYIAFANIDGFRKYLNINPPNMLVMIFGLGLIHGLGLSTRLQEMPLSEDGLLLNIISFNIGIELGQLCALLLMVLAMDVWRKNRSFGQFSVVSNYILILAGTLLFLYQLHGYAHISNPDSFVSTVVQNGPEIEDINPVVVERPITQAETPWKDSINVTIPARGDKEYKFYLEQGSTFEYTWTSGGEALYYDFHGEPKGDTSGYFKSYEESTASQSSGELSAPFAGIHGWYWRNSTSSPVEIELKARGDYKRLDVVETSIENIDTTMNVSTVSENTASSAQTEWQDVITITIPARASKEYKFHLMGNERFEFTWDTGGEALFYDFHGEPEGDTTGYFESYEKKTSRQMTETFTAPFTGIHGWYWKNNSTSPVQITLKARGNYERTDLN